MTGTQETPVALLHGVGLDATMWAPVQDALGRESIAIDLPGHGQQPPLTEPPGQPPLTEPSPQPDLPDLPIPQVDPPGAPA